MDEIRARSLSALAARPGAARAALIFAAVMFSAMTTFSPAAAQTPVPVIQDAELIFEQGLQSFREKDYGMAYRRFRLLYDSYELNRKTTAAHLMAGKSLYREGRYQEAADHLASFIARFPTSGYLDEARRTRTLALEQLGELARARETVDLGIVLPVTGSDASLTQALFNGIRVAVEEHNRTAVEAPRIRMVFRDSRGDAQRASSLVTSLAGSARAIIGPLYSGEARAAAAAAERAGVVLIAPLATDEDVSEGRRFVFQANPTIVMRGRLMARFAIRGLRLNRFGIVAERSNDSISERMAEGFQEEAHLQGAELEFFRLMESSRGWAQVADSIGADTLRRVQAVYLPVAGGRAESNIEAALRSLDRVGVGVRVLGNAEWHDLPFKRQAGTYRATYTNDFYVDSSRPAVQAFNRSFRSIAGSDPDPQQVAGRLGYIGYDVTRHLLAQLAASGGQPLDRALRDAPVYEGLGMRIDFRNGNVNEAMYYFRYRDGRMEQVR